MARSRLKTASWAVTGEPSQKVAFELTVKSYERAFRAMAAEGAFKGA